MSAGIWSLYRLQGLLGRRINLYMTSGQPGKQKHSIQGYSLEQYLNWYPSIEAAVTLCSSQHGIIATA